MQLVEMAGPGGAWRVLVPETRRERMRGSEVTHRPDLARRCCSDDAAPSRRSGCGRRSRWPSSAQGWRCWRSTDAGEGRSSGPGHRVRVTLWSAPTVGRPGSATDSAPHLEDRADDHGPDRRGTHEQEGDHPRSPARAARPAPVASDRARSGRATPGPRGPRDGAYDSFGRTTALLECLVAVPVATLTRCPACGSRGPSS